jgi:hypothetical protein
MDSTLHFLYIYFLDFYLKNIFLPSNFEKILWSNKFLKVTPRRDLFIFKIKMTFASCEIVGFEP